MKMKTNFKVGDDVKYYEDCYSIFAMYGKVIRINRISITVEFENGQTLRVPPKTLNFD